MEIEEYEDIGDYTRKITTNSKEAQIYCDSINAIIWGLLSRGY